MIRFFVQLGTGVPARSASQKGAAFVDILIIAVTVVRPSLSSSSRAWSDRPCPNCVSRPGRRRRPRRSPPRRHPRPRVRNQANDKDEPPRPSPRRVRNHGQRDGRLYGQDWNADAERHVCRCWFFGRQWKVRSEAGGVREQEQCRLRASFSPTSSTSLVLEADHLVVCASFSGRPARTSRSR